MAEKTLGIEGLRLGDFTLLKEAGKGEFSIVCKALYKQDTYFALKRMLLKTEREDASLLLEPCVKLEQHDNVIKYVSHYFHFKTLTVYLVTEYCNTISLNDHLIKDKVNDVCKLAYMEDISKGLHHLHSNGIIHGDLRPPNVLMVPGARRPVCKVSDYTLCLVQKQALKPSDAREIAEYYEAPEVVSKRLYSKSADIYSLALVYYVISSGRQIAKGGRNLLVPAVRHGDKNYTVTVIVKAGEIEQVIRRQFSNLEILSRLIVAMLKLNPAERPLAAEVVKQMGETRQTQASRTLAGDASLMMLLKLMKDALKE